MTRHGIEYRTVDYCGNILRVTHLRDCFDRPTQDPALAERCIVCIGTDLIAATCDDIPIYTVH